MIIFYHFLFKKKKPQPLKREKLGFKKNTIT